MSSELLGVVHRAFAGSMKTMVRYCGGTVEEQDGILMYATPSPSAFPWNGAVRTTPGVPTDRIVERASSYFGRLGHAYSLVAMTGLDDDLIETLGPGEISPEMVIDSAPNRVELPIGARIGRVVSEESRDAFIAVVGEAFETLGEARETWALCYPTVESLSNPDSVATVAYEDDWPAAAGMYYRSGDVIEVLHVGTHSSFRRRGYGRAVTTALTIHGFEQGARISSLQAEPMGYKTYERIGYRTVADFHVYTNH
ncbi:MAG: GNAT family N-acetyltransferase [Acidimicrobiia bacterium]